MSESPGQLGTFVDVDRGGVLQAVRGIGVRFDPIAMLPLLGWQRIRFYRPKEEGGE